MHIEDTSFLLLDLSVILVRQLRDFVQSNRLLRPAFPRQFARVFQHRRSHDTESVSQSVVLLLLFMEYQYVLPSRCAGRRQLWLLARSSHMVMTSVPLSAISVVYIARPPP